MRRGSGGFTLIELLVSLVVGAIVVAGGYQAMVLAGDTRARAAAAREEVSRVTGARDLVSTWLRGVVLEPGMVPFRETPEETWESESVTFRVSHGGALFPGPRWVRLWIERGPGGGGGLMAAVSPRAGEAGDPDVLVLEPRAERLSIRYWGPLEGGVRWVEEWPDPDRLPSVVELELAATPRVRIGPGGGFSDDLPSLMRLPFRIPVALGAN